MMLRRRKKTLEGQLGKREDEDDEPGEQLNAKIGDGNLFVVNDYGDRKLARAQKTGEWTGDASVQVMFLLMISILLLVPLVKGQQQQLYYYVSLPKVGFIRGLRIEALDRVQAGSNKVVPVAAFLGIPYAAPPTGLLRFMPPGAASTVNQRPIEQGHLMMASAAATVMGQSEAQLPPPRVGIRPHVHFGPHCVHLPDWLDPEPQPPLANGSGRPEIGQQSATLLAMNRNKQSEDCLNLNIFIPINEKPLAMQQQQQRQTKFNQNPSQSQASSPSHPQSAYDHYYNMSSLANNNTTGNYHHTQASNANEFLSSSSPPNQASVPVQVWPLPKLGEGEQEASAGLPVLVVVHGTSGGARGRQNSFDYLHLARRTNSLVITFNYRLGLLGFLPYSINERSSSSSASSSSSSRWLSRNNHAIWDQIGLLHWLNRNAIHFDGNPRNITLVAADNQANQFVQLLTMSPLAKGLFNRIVLAYDEGRQNNYYNNFDLDPMPTARPGGYPSPLAKLLARATGARDSRRRLISALMRVVQQMAPEMMMMMTAGAVADDERKALEFVQSINLTRLAKIDQKLRQLTGFSAGSGSSHQGALDEALGPALDDRLLFPQLSALASFQATIGRDVEFFSSKLNYCHYLRQLRAGRPDPLNLLAQSALPRGSGNRGISNSSSPPSSRTGNWHRDANVSRQQQQQHTMGNIDSLNRIVVANFDHLHNLHLLVRLMGFGSQHGSPGDSSDVYTGEGGEEEEDEEGDGDEGDVDDFSEVSRRQQERTVLAAHGAAMLRRQSQSDTTDGGRDTDLLEGQSETAAIPAKRSAPSDPSQDLGQLMELVASVDLMVGYFKKSNGSVPLSFNPVRGSSGGSSLSNITKALFRNQLEDSVNQDQQHYSQNNLLWLLEIADLHYISNLAPADTTAQYCDLFLATTLVPIKSGHVFMVLEQYTVDGDKGRQESNWLIDTANDSSPSTLLDGLGNFVRFGDPNTKSDGLELHINATSGHNWPAYDPLDRKLKLIAANESMQTYHYGNNNLSIQNAFNRFLRDQLGVHLDLMPYLNALELYGRNNISSATTTTIGDTLSSDRFELYNCLKDIDNSIGISPYYGRKQDKHNSIGVPQKFRCLSDLISRFRTLLRQYAADDLEPINKLRHTTTRQITTNSTRSNIAMRNLVSDSSASNNLQQLDQPEIPATLNGILEVPKQSQGQELAKLAGLSGGGGSNGNSSQRKSNSIGGFFERLYKDAAGQALALVVGCGLIIFLVNLAIVVIITIRASRIRRRVGESGHSESDVGPKETGRFVGGLQADELESKQMQANGNTLPSACKRSSMKTTYNGNSATLGHMNQRLGDTHNCHSMQRGVKQLKFDLSGTKLAGPGDSGGNDLLEEDDGLSERQEIERRGGRAAILGSPEIHCPDKTFQQIEPMMFLPTSPDPCNESLLLAGTAAQHDTGKLHLLEDCNGNRLMATVDRGDDNDQHQMGLFTELQELRAQDLAHGGWQVDDSHYLKQANHQNYSHNHLNHQHAHHHKHHEQHNNPNHHHHHHSGSLNSPAFGSQSTNTTNSTTNGVNNSQCHGEGAHHHISQQQQLHQLIGTTSDHGRFFTQNSPDSSATISVTPIQLESFGGVMPLSPIGLQAEGEFNLIEPVGLFYPTGFTSADAIQHGIHQNHGGEQANPNKIFMLDHQQQQQVAFCSRHQRL